MCAVLLRFFTAAPGGSDRRPADGVEWGWNLGRAGMGRIVALLAAVALLPACGHYCRDKTVGAGIYTGFSNHYKACKQECLHDAKECRCSAQCPCWKAENHPKVGEPVKNP